MNDLPPEKARPPLLGKDEGVFFLVRMHTVACMSASSSLLFLNGSGTNERVSEHYLRTYIYCMHS